MEKAVRWNLPGLGALLGCTVGGQGSKGVENSDKKVINGPYGFSGIDMGMRKEQINGLRERGGQEVCLTC